MYITYFLTIADQSDTDLQDLILLIPIQYACSQEIIWLIGLWH